MNLVYRDISNKKRILDFIDNSKIYYEKDLDGNVGMADYGWRHLYRIYRHKWVATESHSLIRSNIKKSIKYKKNDYFRDIAYLDSCIQGEDFWCNTFSDEHVEELNYMLESYND